MTPCASFCRFLFHGRRFHTLIRVYSCISWIICVVPVCESYGRQDSGQPKSNGTTHKVIFPHLVSFRYLDWHESKLPGPFVDLYSMEGTFIPSFGFTRESSVWFLSVSPMGDRTQANPRATARHIRWFFRTLFLFVIWIDMSQNCQKLLQFSRGEPEWGLEVVFNQQTESISRASYRTLCTLSKEYRGKKQRMQSSRVVNLESWCGTIRSSRVSSR